MKMLLFAAVVAAVVLLVGFFLLARFSRNHPPPTGLVLGRLRTCPQTANCVCSETAGTGASVEPLRFDGPRDEAWARVRTAVGGIGGSVERDDGDYLWAVFLSPFFGFADDLELRIDAVAQVIHVRSASRVGSSDLGVNRRRVEALRRAFEGN